MLTRTTTALLNDLLNPANEAVWREFDARYRPILVGLGRRLGLSEEDAADSAQEALLEFVRSYRAGQYDRHQGRLRSWLIGIARHCVADISASRGRRRIERGLSAINELPDESELAPLWDEEERREILRRALERLRTDTHTESQTIRAFEMIAFEGCSPNDVAADLGMSLNDVYLAKHRCLRRMRAFVAEISEAFEVFNGARQ